MAVDRGLNLGVEILNSHRDSIESQLGQHRDLLASGDARINLDGHLGLRFDFEMPGDTVTIHRDGDRLIIEPVRRKDLVEVLASLEPLGSEDQFPDIDENLLPAKDIVL